MCHFFHNYSGRLTLDPVWSVCRTFFFSFFSLTYNFVICASFSIVRLFFFLTRYFICILYSQYFIIDHIYVNFYVFCLYDTYVSWFKFSCSVLIRKLISSYVICKVYVDIFSTLSSTTLECVCICSSFLIDNSVAVCAKHL